MEAVCTVSSVNSKLQSTILHLRDQLDQCKEQVLELNSLQVEFRTKLSSLLRRMDKENIAVQQKLSPCVVTLTDSETQTCELLPRRWNSDLSLDLDGKSNGKRYQRVERSDLSNFCISTDAMAAPPIIRQQSQKKVALKSKFTNRLDVGGHGIGKNQVDNLLLSDLGLTSQAPEFSQSEFNLSSDDHWLKESQKQSGGRVRFLSHDDGQGGLNEEEDLEIMKDLPQQSQIFHSHSGSWATLTHSERDLSEMDSCLSLNYQDQTGEPKFASSTPYKNLRSKFKQSVSFNGCPSFLYIHFAYCFVNAPNFFYLQICFHLRLLKVCRICKNKTFPEVKSLHGVRSPSPETSIVQKIATQISDIPCQTWSNALTALRPPLAVLLLQVNAKLFKKYMFIFQP